MTLFRLYLAAWLLILTAYTIPVVLEHGLLSLLPVFFGDMLVMAWPGQFNLDFFGFLTLSALWVSWRHHFSKAGLCLGLLALFGGIPFLAIYLLILLRKHDDTIAIIMLGEQRVEALKGA